MIEDRSLASKNKPLVYEYELVLKTNSRNLPIDWVNVPITAGISLDFASNYPFALPARPSLILGAAHTWHPSIGMAMWQQAKARAEEIGSVLLWCDGGEGGVSGVAAPGIDEILQVGSGSWVRSIGLKLPIEEGRTAYGFFGALLPIPFIWGVFGVEWIVERAVMNFKRERGRSLSFSRLWAEFSRLWTKQGTDEDDTEAGEQASLLHGGN